MESTAGTSTPSFTNNFIGLNEFVVHFSEEVSTFFNERIGKDEFLRICKKSCQAPPYTSIRIDLLKTSRESALAKVEELLKPYNEILVSENRQRIKPYLHEVIPELIIIPSVPSVCPSVDILKTYPIVLIDRMCAESVLRGSDIFVKGVRGIDKTATKDQKVCLVVDLCNCDLPRGSDVSMFTGRNIILGDGILRLNRSEVFTLDSGLCINSIHRVSFDLPPLQVLPAELLMQNYPSLLTSKVLDPHENDIMLDCCAAPGNKWSHLAMLMNDKGLLIGMDRSRKKAIENLLSIKDKYQYKCLQIRYVDMTKGVMSEEEEARLMKEKEDYMIDKTEDQLVSPQTSKSFMKKMLRIQKQKERKERERLQKNGKEVSMDVSDVVITEEQTQQLLTKYSQSKKNQEKMKKNAEELKLLDSIIAENTPEPLKNLLFAGIHAGTARIPGFPRGVFNRILLDPPCSALGLRPRLSHMVTMEELYGYRSYQRQFIDVAIRLLAVGGELVYSTCTYDPLENEENVAFILKNYPMELMDSGENYREGKEGLPNCGLTEEQCKMVQRFNMTENCDSIGFFISKFRKVSDF